MSNSVYVDNSTDNNNKTNSRIELHQSSSDRLTNFEFSSHERKINSSRRHNEDLSSNNNNDRYYESINRTSMVNNNNNRTDKYSNRYSSSTLISQQKQLSPRLVSSSEKSLKSTLYPNSKYNTNHSIMPNPKHVSSTRCQLDDYSSTTSRYSNINNQYGHSNNPYGGNHHQYSRDGYGSYPATSALSSNGYKSQNRLVNSNDYENESNDLKVFTSQKSNFQPTPPSSSPLLKPKIEVNVKDSIEKEVKTKPKSTASSIATKPQVQTEQYRKSKKKKQRDIEQQKKSQRNSRNRHRKRIDNSSSNDSESPSSCLHSNISDNSDDSNEDDVMFSTNSSNSVSSQDESSDQESSSSSSRSHSSSSSSSNTSTSTSSSVNSHKKRSTSPSLSNTRKGHKTKNKKLKNVKKKASNSVSRPIKISEKNNVKTKRNNVTTSLRNSVPKKSKSRQSLNKTPTKSSISAVQTPANITTRDISIDSITSANNNSFNTTSLNDSKLNENNNQSKLECNLNESASVSTPLASTNSLQSEVTIKKEPNETISNSNSGKSTTNRQNSQVAAPNSVNKTKASSSQFQTNVNIPLEAIVNYSLDDPRKTSNKLHAAVLLKLIRYDDTKRKTSNATSASNSPFSNSSKKQTSKQQLQQSKSPVHHHHRHSAIVETSKSRVQSPPPKIVNDKKQRFLDNSDIDDSTNNVSMNSNDDLNIKISSGDRPSLDERIKMLDEMLAQQDRNKTSSFAASSMKTAVDPVVLTPTITPTSNAPSTTPTPCVSTSPHPAIASVSKVQTNVSQIKPKLKIFDADEMRLKSSSHDAIVTTLSLQNRLQTYSTTLTMTPSATTSNLPSSSSIASSSVNTNNSLITANVMNPVNDLTTLKTSLCESKFKLNDDLKSNLKELNSPLASKNTEKLSSSYNYLQTPTTTTTETSPTSTKLLQKTTPLTPAATEAPVTDSAIDMPPHEKSLPEDNNNVTKNDAELTTQVSEIKTDEAIKDKNLNAISALTPTSVQIAAKLGLKIKAQISNGPTVSDIKMNSMDVEESVSSDVVEGLTTKGVINEDCSSQIKRPLEEMNNEIESNTSPTIGTKQVPSLVEGQMPKKIKLEEPVAKEPTKTTEKPNKEASKPKIDVYSTKAVKQQPESSVKNVDKGKSQIMNKAEKKVLVEVKTEKNAIRSEQTNNVVKSEKIEKKNEVSASIKHETKNIKQEGGETLSTPKPVVNIEKDKSQPKPQQQQQSSKKLPIIKQEKKDSDNATKSSKSSSTQIIKKAPLNDLYDSEESDNNEKPKSQKEKSQNKLLVHQTSTPNSVTKDVKKLQKQNKKTDVELSDSEVSNKAKVTSKEATKESKDVKLSVKAPVKAPATTTCPPANKPPVAATSSTNVQKVATTKKPSELNSKLANSTVKQSSEINLKNTSAPSTSSSSSSNSKKEVKKVINKNSEEVKKSIDNNNNKKALKSNKTSSIKKSLDLNDVSSASSSDEVRRHRHHQSDDDEDEDDDDDDDSGQQSSSNEDEDDDDESSKKNTKSSSNSHRNLKRLGLYLFIQFKPNRKKILKLFSIYRKKVVIKNKQRLEELQGETKVKIKKIKE